MLLNGTTSTKVLAEYRNRMMEPFAACLLISSELQAPRDCRYSPEDSRQAPMSPRP